MQGNEGSTPLALAPQSETVPAGIRENPGCSVLQAALIYASRGWAVFPVNGKIPHKGTNGFLDATTEPEQIRAWWRKWPDSGVAIATGERSGIVVLDVDGEEGKESIRGKHLPLTVTAATPGRGGGVHRYFRYIPGMRSTSLLHKVDLKASGGYVVASPSPHPDGGRYDWADGMAPEDVDVADPPKWIIDLARKGNGEGGVPIEWGATIIEGARNAELARRAGSLLARMSPADAAPMLQAWNRERCQPPLPEDEVEGILASIAKREASKATTPAGRLTETGNAERFTAEHGEGLRYCFPMRSWLWWDGRHWVKDAIGEVMRRGKQTIRSLYAEAAGERDDSRRKELGKWARTSDTERGIKAMISLAQSEPGIPILPDALDADPWLLAAENGVIDLRSGELLPHSRERMISKLAPVEYDPAARDTTLDKYLRDVTGGDEDFLAYIQRAIGYSLSGSTAEEVFFLVLGPAATGKSTLVEAMLAMLGGYGRKASFDTFLERRDVGSPRPDIAALAGVRFVAAVETAQTRHLAAPVVKELTGSDTVTARHLYQEPISFRPVLKLWLAANDAPTISDVDSGIWRRLRRLPFEHVVEKPDKSLKAHLSSLDGRKAILAWAVEGCLAWQRQGLGSCSRVEERTAELRTSMNPIAEFLNTRCRISRNAETPAQNLRGAYEEWAHEVGAKPLSDRAWGKRLQDQGCQRVRLTIDGRRVTCWRGIELLSDTPGDTHGHTKAGIREKSSREIDMDKFSENALLCDRGVSTYSEESESGTKQTSWTHLTDQASEAENVNVTPMQEVSQRTCAECSMWASGKCGWFDPPRDMPGSCPACPEWDVGGE